MSRVAVVNPGTLLGKELLPSLEKRPDLWREIHLLTTTEEGAGAVAAVRGEARLVAPYRSGELEGLDVVFLCGPWAALAEPLAQLPDGVRAVVLSPEADSGVGHLLVEGVNLRPPLPDGVLVSPHPAAVALAQLLHPLRRLGLARGLATLVQPVSIRDKEGLDELFEQTRAILSFSGRPPAGPFDHQLAFNLLPADAETPVVQRQLVAVLQGGEELSLQVLQGGVFHGLAVSLCVGFAGDPGGEAVRGALAASPALELVDDPSHLGPIDAVARDKLLVGRVAPDALNPGLYWVWAVVDSLTLGGALNAVAIAEALWAAETAGGGDAS